MQWYADQFDPFVQAYENQPAFKRGCRTGGVYNWKTARPQWVGTEPTVSESIKVFEGVIAPQEGSSKVATTDFHPNHFRHDWNFFVQPDFQYRYMLTDKNANWNGWGDVMENEWDLRDFAVFFAPSAGDRIALFGKHIFDCAHPPMHTEIHPPFGLVAMRRSGIRPRAPYYGHEHPRHPGFDPADESPDTDISFFIPCTYGHVFFDRYGGLAWSPPTNKPSGAWKYARDPFGTRLPGNAIPRDLATGRDYTFDVYPPIRRPTAEARLHIEFPFANRDFVIAEGRPRADDPLYYRVTVKGQGFAQSDSMSFWLYCFWDPTASQRGRVRRYRVRFETLELAGPGAYKLWGGVTGSWVQFHQGDDPLPGSLAGRIAYPVGIDFIATLLDDEPLRISVSGFEEEDAEDDDIGIRDVVWKRADLDDLGLAEPGPSNQSLNLEGDLWRLVYRIDRLPP